MKILKNHSKPGIPHYLVLIWNHAKPGTIQIETVLNGDSLYFCHVLSYNETKIFYALTQTLIVNLL